METEEATEATKGMEAILVGMEVIPVAIKVTAMEETDTRVGLKVEPEAAVEDRLTKGLYS
jgi:hypothetical protein